MKRMRTILREIRFSDKKAIRLSPRNRNTRLGLKITVDGRNEAGVDFIASVFDEDTDIRTNIKEIKPVKEALIENQENINSYFSEEGFEDRWSDFLNLISYLHTAAKAQEKFKWDGEDEDVLSDEERVYI